MRLPCLRTRASTHARARPRRKPVYGFAEDGSCDSDVEELVHELQGVGGGVTPLHVTVNCAARTGEPISMEPHVNTTTGTSQKVRVLFSGPEPPCISAHSLLLRRAGADGRHRCDLQCPHAGHEHPLERTSGADCENKSPSGRADRGQPRRKLQVAFGNEKPAGGC